MNEYIKIEPTPREIIIRASANIDATTLAHELLRLLRDRKSYTRISIFMDEFQLWGYGGNLIRAIMQLNYAGIEVNVSLCEDQQDIHDLLLEAYES